MSYYEAILDSLKQPRRRAYRPQFRVAREELGWRVFDGARPIGFLRPTAFDLWAFSPFEPDVKFNREPPGKVWDLYTVHNTYVNLGAMCWPRHWLEQIPAGSEGVRWTWKSARGARLEAMIRADFADGEGIRWVFTIEYDPAWARYRYRFDLAARKREPAGFELLNLMLAGALVSRPGERRWSHSVWEDPSGQLRRIVHSNALFTCTDYAPAHWRTRNGPLRGGWIAYAPNPRFNPAIVIHATSVAPRFATCSQLFDEHVMWGEAGQENLEPDGYYHFRMAAEFLDVPARLARRLFAAAADPVRPARWRHKASAVPFHMDVVNSFETAVDPWEPEECPILVVPEGEDGPVAWARDAAHSGRRSLRLRGQAETGRQVLFPTGAVCNVKPHRRYRLSGWIRTRGVKRYARLELFSYEYGYGNVIDLAQSPTVNGTSGWTRVEAELDSGDEAYVMPRFVLYGPGTAWFDDVALEEAR